MTRNIANAETILWKKKRLTVDALHAGDFYHEKMPAPQSPKPQGVIMIYRATINYRKDGNDALWVHEYRGKGNFDVCWSGDYFSCVSDLPKKAFEFARIAHKARRKQFYFHDYK